MMHVTLCVGEKNGKIKSFIYSISAIKLCFVINVLNNEQ